MPRGLKCIPVDVGCVGGLIRQDWAQVLVLDVLAPSEESEKNKLTKPELVFMNPTCSNLLYLHIPLYCLSVMLLHRPIQKTN